MLRWTLIDPLVWLTRSLIVQRILRSRWFVLAWRFVLEPGALSALVWWMLPRSTIRHWPTETAAAVSLFLAANLLLNSRVGRNLQEMAVDSLVQGWHNYGVRLLVGCFTSSSTYSARCSNGPNAGCTPSTNGCGSRAAKAVALVGKAALSLIWFWVTYFCRFGVNVLIEPQINPIKHFPVVTVSHKLLLAAYIPFADFLDGSAEHIRVEAYSWPRSSSGASPASSASWPGNSARTGGCMRRTGPTGCGG